jgi:hypothetical protein
VHRRQHKSLPHMDDAHHDLVILSMIITRAQENSHPITYHRWNILCEILALSYQPKALQLSLGVSLLCQSWDIAVQVLRDPLGLDSRKRALFCITLPAAIFAEASPPHGAKLIRPHNSAP